MSFSYRQFRPARDLAALVDAYWITEAGPRRECEVPTDRVLPDGCIDLVFVRTAAGARLFSSPLIEEPTLLDPSSEEWFVGVRMRTAMSGAVLPVSPVECRDRAIDAVELDPRFSELEERLVACATPERALAILRGEVDRRARAHLDHVPPARVRGALALLTGGPPWRSHDEVASAVGIAPRSLHRDIVRWTGHAPKVLARIARMQHALARLRANERSLAEVAAASGFADQPHMTRELRRLTGLRPSELSGTFKTARAARSMVGA
jgi:AraC-like DNA-binding protein